MNADTDIKKDHANIELVALAREVVHLLKQNMHKAFESSGITPPQGMVLGVLSRYGTMKISELSDKIGVTNSTVSGIIDRLESQGLVQRERGTEDRRAVFVSICPKYEEKHREMARKAEGYFIRLIDQGAPEEITKITEAMGILKRLLSMDPDSGR